MASRSATYGGNGGSPFSGGEWKPTKGSTIQLRHGNEVDAIILDGEHYGGNGGSLSQILTFGEGEYINSFQVRSGARIDFLYISTNFGQTISGGGSGGGIHSESSLHVVSLTGRSGSRLDQLKFTWEPDVNATKTVTFGGTGGGNFDPLSIYNLGIKTGSRVDAMYINGKRFGGSGGGSLQQIALRQGEYINSFTIRSGNEIDNVIFTTNKGQTLGGGGSGGGVSSFSGVRLTSIGGRSGARLDQLRISYIDNYVASTVLDKTATFFINGKPEGKYEFYTETNITRDESIETTSSFAVTAGVSAEFWSTVSVNLETSYSTQEQVTKAISEAKKDSTTTTYTIPDNKAFIQVTAGDIMDSPDGNPWLLPTNSDSHWDIMGVDSLSSYLAQGKKVVDTGGYVRMITGFEAVAQLDTSIKGNFDVYVAKEKS